MVSFEDCQSQYTMGATRKSACYAAQNVASAMVGAGWTKKAEGWWRCEAGYACVGKEGVEPTIIMQRPDSWIGPEYVVIEATEVSNPDIVGIGFYGMDTYPVLPSVDELLPGCSKIGTDSWDYHNQQEYGIYIGQAATGVRTIQLFVVCSDGVHAGGFWSEDPSALVTFQVNHTGAELLIDGVSFIPVMVEDSPYERRFAVGTYVARAQLDESYVEESFTVVQNVDQVVSLSILLSTMLNVTSVPTGVAVSFVRLS